MSTPNVEIADSLLSIEDVFLVEVNSKVSRDFNQTDRSVLEAVSVNRVHVEEQVFAQLRIPANAPEERFLIIRYFFVGECQIAKPGVKVSGEISPADQLATIRLTFAVDYSSKTPDQPAPEVLGAFASNVHVHVWPYWREALQHETVRLRLPAIMTPLIKVSPVRIGQIAPGNTTITTAFGRGKASGN